jgi:hypothetical protein
MRFDFGNVLVPNARVLRDDGAHNRVLGWWDRDLDCRTEAFGKSLNRWLAIVSTVRKKQVNSSVDLIQQAWQRGLITNVISGQIRADDLAAHKIKTKAQLAPGPSFALGFMLFLKPFTFAKDL